MKNEANRRQYPRHTALFSAKYTVKEGTFRDLVNNIGAGGVFVNTRRKINPGRSINLQFPIFAFKKRLSLMGTVIWCNSNGFAVMFDKSIEEKLSNEGQFPGIIIGRNRSA